MDSGTVKLQQKCKKKGGKKAIIIIIKAVKDAVSGPFSKHLSPSLRANTLIIKGLENRSDSDRCFATFYFTRVEQNTPAKSMKMLTIAQQHLLRQSPSLHDNHTLTFRQIERGIACMTKR